MKRKISKISFLLLIFIIIYSNIPISATTLKDTLNSSTILIDVTRGQVLHEENADAQISSAIMSKLMTALITLEQAELNEQVTISKNAAKINGSSLDLVVGNKYTVEDLLYAVILSQGNDAAIALAEYVGNGDVNKFVNMMNVRAKELSLKNTFFVNPTGLFDENQYTTVRDIAKFTKTALSNQLFNAAFGSKGIGWLNGKDSLVLTNQNKLFWSYEGVDGGKIGATPQGTSIVTTSTQNNRRLIAVVYNKNEEKAYIESTNLFNYGFSRFITGVLVPRDTVLQSITIDDVNVDLVSKINVYYTYPIGESYIKSIDFTKNDKLKLPISTDTIAGVLYYTLNDDTTIEINLYSNQTIAAPEDYHTKILSIINENRDLVMIVIILLIVEFCLIIYNIIKLFVRLAKKTKTH